MSQVNLITDSDPYQNLLSSALSSHASAALRYERMWLVETTRFWHLHVFGVADIFLHVNSYGIPEP